MTREDDAKKAEQEIQRLRKLPDNRACANCLTPGAPLLTGVVMPFKIFVCDSCKSAHQSFSHRCKSTQMSIWTMEEVRSLEDRSGGGNRAAQDSWLYHCRDADRPRKGDSAQRFKDFVEKAYVQEKWAQTGKDTSRSRPSEESCNARRPAQRDDPADLLDEPSASFGSFVSSSVPQSSSVKAPPASSSAVGTIDLFDTAPSSGFNVSTNGLNPSGSGISGSDLHSKGFSFNTSSGDEFNPNVRGANGCKPNGFQANTFTPNSIGDGGFNPNRSSPDNFDPNGGNYAGFNPNEEAAFAEFDPNKGGAVNQDVFDPFAAPAPGRSPNETTPQQQSTQHTNSGFMLMQQQHQLLQQTSQQLQEQQPQQQPQQPFTHQQFQQPMQNNQHMFMQQHQQQLLQQQHQQQLQQQHMKQMQPLHNGFGFSSAANGCNVSNGCQPRPWASNDFTQFVGAGVSHCSPAWAGQGNAFGGYSMPFSQEQAMAARGPQPGPPVKLEDLKQNLQMLYAASDKLAGRA